jgi:hypothetical protein
VGKLLKWPTQLEKGEHILKVARHLRSTAGLRQRRACKASMDTKAPPCSARTTR